MFYDLNQAVPSEELEGQVVVPTTCGSKVETGFYSHFEFCNALFDVGGWSDDDEVVVELKKESRFCYEVIVGVLAAAFLEDSLDAIDEGGVMVRTKTYDFDGYTPFIVSFKCSIAPTSNEEAKRLITIKREEVII